MKARNGQIAIVLALVLVAICILAVMNVGVFLAIRAKNRAMNAGDAAAIAVAELQGELINEIGRANLKHLKLVARCRKGDDTAKCREKCREIESRQARLCFLGPIDGIKLGSEKAAGNGAEANEEMADILKEHVIDVRTLYKNNPSSYPEPWEGAWEEYAQQLELALGGALTAGPDNIEYVDAQGGHYLMNRQFYNAIAGRNWCWFHFNAMSLLDAYSSFGDWAPIPSPDDRTRRLRCVNCEVYSLHLEPKSGSALDLLGRDLIRQLTGLSDSEIDESILLHDIQQTWYFYDMNWWDAWSTHAGIEFRPDNFPIIGEVKREYDVYGASARCRVYANYPDVVSESGERSFSWSSAAKPFGTVDAGGSVSPVTSLKGFVVEAFKEARLVPVDAAGGRDTSTADYNWVRHVNKHLEGYLANGPVAGSGCWYCKQLVEWEQESLRISAREWLRANSDSCERSSGTGSERGGTMHGH